MDEQHHPTKRILDLQSHRARSQIRQWQVSAKYKVRAIYKYTVKFDYSKVLGTLNP